MYLVVFLGNPGTMYARNRHNAGRLLAERLAYSLSWQKKFKGLFSSTALQKADSSDACSSISPNMVYFLQPETYMNLSGESVAAAAAFYKIPSNYILVVHDELELALGQASLKFSGGLGGHNGLRSIKASLGSADFWRLRIGIGRPSAEKNNADISGWVLSNFSADEEPILNQVLAGCETALHSALLFGPESLLPQWQKIKIAA